MLDEEDLKDNAQRRTVAKGRRANNETSNQVPPWSLTEVSEDAAIVLPKDEVNTTDDLLAPTIPRAPRRKRELPGGWETETLEEDSRFLVKDSDEEDGIPFIPTLGEEEEEILEEEIASPPTNLVSDLLSFNDLNREMVDYGAVQRLDGDIDMKPLTRNLLSVSEICEEDKPWNFNELFTEVMTSVQYHESALIREMLI